MVSFVKATKSQSRLRMTIDGPSGSGKTFTALTFAMALANGGQVAVIDTERGSASKYADRFVFDVLELDSYAPEKYVEGIKAAEDAGFDVLVIDSLSHAWEGKDGILEQHDQVTTASRSGNSYMAWRTVTPRHRELVDAMLQSRCHVIATMRSKMDYIQQKDSRDRTVIKKVGMAPIQRQGMEYEFDIVADMDVDHNMVISKTRCFEVDGNVIKKPDAKWFATVAAWLTDGAPRPEEPEQIAPEATPEPADPTPKPHWIDNPKIRARFWAWTGTDLGLTNDQVHDALDVESVKGYEWSMDDAKAAILAWVDEQSKGGEKAEALL